MLEKPQGRSGHFGEKKNFLALRIEEENVK
jgi:hypothetical protein